MKKVILSNEMLLSEVGMLLSFGKSITLKAKGNSMLPFIIGEKDSVAIKRKERYKRGDIVLAKLSTNHWVLHRIIMMNNQAITLMGDGNISETEQCSIHDIYGYVTTICRVKKQPIDCNTLYSRIKAFIWYQLLPFRRYLLAIYKLINKKNEN